MGLNKTLIFFLMAGLMTASCAYRLSGGDEPPFGIRRVSVHMFENKSSETGAETRFANDLIYELARDSRLTITGMGDADACFYGVIKSLEIDLVSRERSNLTLERRVTASVDMRLESKTGRILWSGENLRASDTYRVDPDKRKTEQNMREAISQISRKIAQNVYQRLTWGDKSS